MKKYFEVITLEESTAIMKRIDQWNSQLFYHNSVVCEKAIAEFLAQEIGKSYYHNIEDLRDHD